FPCSADARGAGGCAGAVATRSRGAGSAAALVCGSSEIGPPLRFVVGRPAVAPDGGALDSEIPPTGRPLRSVPSGRIGTVRIRLGSLPPAEGAADAGAGGAAAGAPVPAVGTLVRRRGRGGNTGLRRRAGAR